MTDKQTLNQNTWRNYTALWDRAYVVSPKFSNFCDNLHMIPKKKIKTWYWKHLPVALWCCRWYRCPLWDCSCKLNQRNCRNSCVIYSQLISSLSEPRKASCLLWANKNAWVEEQKTASLVIIHYLCGGDHITTQNPLLLH